MDRLHIATRADKSKPQFFASHHPKPNHTPQSFKGTKKQFDDYRKEYQARSATVAKLMDSMITEIRSADPTSIVFVFGDHGPYTKRHVSYAHDPEGVVQDRHGIMGAVFGADEWPAVHAAQSRHTISNLRPAGGRAAPVSFGRNEPAAAGRRFRQDYPGT
jgi:hypothetical protein